jgi:hypothetical protein
MKTKNIFKQLSILAFTAFIFSSCEDVVHVDLNDEDVDLVAVEAYISTKAEDNVYVKIERTTEIDDTTGNPVVSNAVVKLSDDAATPNSVTLEEQGTSGIYLLPEGTSYPGVTGRTYTLIIITTDGTVITAEEYLSEIATLDTVKINLSDELDYEYLGVYVCAQEPPGEGNYYKWDIYVNGEMLNDTEDLMFESDELVDGNYIDNFLILLDSEDNEEDKKLHTGDTVVVEQLSISEAVYDFYKGMDNQASSGSFMGVPSANVPSNLNSSNGERVVGLFSARDISTGNTVIIDDSNYTPME